MIVDIKQVAVGKWASILTLLGMPREAFNGKHQSCPICGDGKDRFRWNAKTEYAHCNQCGSRSAIDLAMAYTGRSFKELATEIKNAYLGQAKMNVDVKPDDIEKNKARLKAIHKGLVKLDGSKGVEYFKGRGLSVLPGKDCFFSPVTPYYNEGRKVADLPAIVSAFRTVNGELSTYHITYLSTDCTKKHATTPKKMLPTVLSLTGCAIQLFQPDKILGIAEGVETALAVHQLEGLPVWAAGNAQLMAALEIPSTVEELWIYADNDENFTGQKAAYTLANRYALKGIKTRVCQVVNGIWQTDEGDKVDFLDYLQKGNMS